MKTKLLTIVSFINLILFLNANAQEVSQVQTEVKYKHSLGAGIGFTTGYGLSYRYNPNKFGIQVNFAPFKNNTTTRISSGLTFTYDLIGNNVSRLYLYQANHFYYDKYKNEFYDLNGNKYYDTNLSEYFNNGFGFGFEITAAKRVGFNLMTGYAFYKNFEEINMTGELGIYFKF